MKHTKEPWTYNERTDRLIDAHGNNIAVMFYSVSDDETLANAQRIVACVNACAGITNEALDAGIVDDLVTEAMRSGMYWYKDDIEILEEEV